MVDKGTLSYFDPNNVSNLYTYTRIHNHTRNIYKQTHTRLTVRFPSLSEALGSEDFIILNSIPKNEEFCFEKFT